MWGDITRGSSLNPVASRREGSGVKFDGEVVYVPGVEGVDGGVGFVGELFGDAAEFFHLRGDDVGRDLAWTGGIVFEAGVEVGLEEDQVDRSGVGIGQFEQGASIGGQEVRGVGDGESVVFEAIVDDLVHEAKGVWRDGLVGGVVADDFAALVGADNLRRLKEFVGEVGFSAASGSAEDDERVLRERDQVHGISHLRVCGYSMMVSAGKAMETAGGKIKASLVAGETSTRLFYATLVSRARRLPCQSRFLKAFRDLVDVATNY